MDIQTIFETLIAASANQSKEISQLRSDLANAFRQIGELRSALTQQAASKDARS